MFQVKRSEDTISYRLFPDIGCDVDALEDKRTEYLSFLSSWLIPYIWQNDSFHLNTGDSSLTTAPHLSGSVNVGDNVEDEWFILFLLKSLTQLDTGLVVQVNDSDGEFLLIEAAEYLPSWLEPETAENRIWLYQGQVHIIPRPKSSKTPSPFPLTSPSLETGVDLVRTHSSTTEASVKVQRAILAKISGYPAAITQKLHRVNLRVPLKVAHLLHRDPQIISTAVNAFYYRDAIDLKSCRPMKHYRPENLVTVPVTFSRCLYAQLSQQKFVPDARSGWTLTNPRDPGFRGQDLGMKLSHGFEIAVSRLNLPSSASSMTSSPSTSMVNERDPGWIKFKARLNNIGYFKNELEGSRLYTQLLEKAKEFYKDTIASRTLSTSEPQDRLKRLFLESPDPLSLDQLRAEEKCLPPDDDESWINVSPEQLDAMLHNLESGSHHSEDISQAVNRFVSKVSSVDGVEFPSNNMSHCDEEDDGGGQGLGSLIRSMTEALTIQDDPGFSSEDDELEDYASDSSALSSSEDTPPPPVRGLPDDELAQMDKDRRARAMRDEMRNMRRYMRQMDQELTADSQVMKGVKKASDVFPSPPTVPQSKDKKKKDDNASKRAQLAQSEDLDSDDSLPEDLEGVGVPSRLQVNAALSAELQRSFLAQGGAPGPGGTLLQAMGVSMHARTAQMEAPTSAKGDRDNSSIQNRQPGNHPRPSPVGQPIPPRPSPVGQPIPPRPAALNKPIPPRPAPRNQEVPPKPSPVNQPIPPKLVPVNQGIPSRPAPRNQEAPLKPAPLNQSIPPKPSPVNQPIPPKPALVNQGIPPRPSNQPTSPVRVQSPPKPTSPNPRMSSTSPPTKSPRVEVPLPTRTVPVNARNRQNQSEPSSRPRLAPTVSQETDI